MVYNKLMQSDHRQNTSKFSSEKSQRKGLLKIFLGYAAGVGKTFAMLESAQKQIPEGRDIVIGYVDTHNSPEMDLLAEKFEKIPVKMVASRAVELPEIDIEAILVRRPQLVLIDDLSHANTISSRHPKRYQDIEELLSAGIDIYTTLNIQNLESLNDIVAQITGVHVLETIPDSLLEPATEIQLVDLPPEELLLRLSQGKVYIPEQAVNSRAEFFRKGNLTALREICLRRATEQIDNQMRAYMLTSAIPGPWHASERLIACIAPNELGEHILRSTRRLADELNAEWFAVYVENPIKAPLSLSQQHTLENSLRLAKELGARTKILAINPNNPTIAGTVCEYARKHNITKIIAGKSIRPFWQELLHRSVVEQLIRQSGNIDIFVISGSLNKKARPAMIAWAPHRPWLRYAGGLILVLAATLISELFGHKISPANLVMVYLLAVVLAAVYLGRGPAVLTSLVSVLAFDYFFVSPRFSFSVADTEYLLTFGGLLIVGWVISYLTSRAKEQAESAQQREADTAMLYALSRDLAISDGFEAVIQAIQIHIEQGFGREVVIHLAKAGEMNPRNAISSNSDPDETELAVAYWAFKNGESAGRGTHTIPTARYHYVPLKTARGTIGVLGVQPRESDVLTQAERRLLEAFASQFAQALERVQLAEQARQIKLLQAAEKLQNALLNSISHDLRTPLVSITGALTALEQETQMDETARRSLVETAREEADRLNRLVGNLLDMTRLESGALHVKSEICDAQDLIGTALGQMEGRLGARQIRVMIAPDMPLIPMDFVLIVHVLTNLLDNALKYSPANSPLEIQASQKGNEAQIGIADHGLGVPEEDLSRIFDKFYRVQRPEQVTGTGLGLAISKGIIEAHGEHIWAKAREGGGTIITFGLPLGIKE